MIVIISDIHLNFKKAQQIIDHYNNNNYNEFILLGDELDDWNDTVEQNVETIQWLLNVAKKTNVTCLWGNHTISYLIPSARCSGWTPEKQKALNPYLPALVEHSKFFKWLNIAGNPFLFSHAGLHPSFLPPFMKIEEISAWLEQEQEKAFESIKLKREHWFYQAGISRGGRHAFGGLTWLDWEEFEPIKGINMICGHTPGKNVRTKYVKDSLNYCIDTKLRHYMTIGDEGNIQIHETSSL